MFGGLRKANEHVYKKSNITKNYMKKPKLFSTKEMINKRIKKECTNV